MRMIIIAAILGGCLLYSLSAQADGECRPEQRTIVFVEAHRLQDPWHCRTDGYRGPDIEEPARQRQSWQLNLLDLDERTRVSVNRRGLRLEIKL